MVIVSMVSTASASEFYGKVTKVIDGDTIKVTLSNYWVPPLLGENLGIRLLGVNTPESRSKDVCEKYLGLKAKEFAKAVIKVGAEVRLTKCVRGKYFRLVCEYDLFGGWIFANPVFAKWISFKEGLIKTGLAQDYDGGTKPKTNWCKLKEELEEKAIASEISQ